MKTLRSALLGWFARSKRDLPWRRTTDPYAIWVSEVMLQQTQVDRVVPYFERFLKRFPDIEALASASASDVLALWSGLGYYSRARHLHRTAQEVVDRFGGELPRTLEALLALPGFGRYTAGAVASIAFGLEAPVVDGNVARVLSRVLEIEGGPQDKPREVALWAAADRLVRGPSPGALNEALMELGATVCLPTSPLCHECPLQRDCRALAHGRVSQLPHPKKAAARKTLDLAVAVAHRRGRVLLALRPEKGLFGGLWEMPSRELKGTGVATLRRLMGKGSTIGPEMTVVERTLTHRLLRLHLHPVSASLALPAAPAPYVEWRWVPFAETARLAMSAATHAALRTDFQGASQVAGAPVRIPYVGSKLRPR